MGTDAGPARLAAGLSGADSVDDVASRSLRAATGLPHVVRAALALTVVGGRQLRFVSSDEDRWEASPRWCLIDAYDSLPLNDAVRTGHHVLLADPRALADGYPDLAARQLERGVRSLAALALVHHGRRLGGLLLYLDRELPAERLGPAGDLGWLPDVVTGALLAVEARARTAVGAPVVPAQAAMPGGRHRRLPADETAPGLARAFLREVLADWDLGPEVVDAALLCATELVTNVVMHAARPSVISVRRLPGAVAVQLRHAPAGPTRAARAGDATDPLRIAGRGLALVEAMSSSWGSETTDAETCVWFHCDAPRPRRTAGSGAPAAPARRAGH